MSEAPKTVDGVEMKSAGKELHLHPDQPKENGIYQIGEPKPERKREGRQVGVGGKCVHCGNLVMAMGRKWRRHYEQSKKWGHLKGKLYPGAHCPRCKVPYIPDGFGPKQ